MKGSLSQNVELSPTPYEAISRCEWQLHCTYQAWNYRRQLHYTYIDHLLIIILLNQIINLFFIIIIILFCFNLKYFFYALIW